MEHPAAEMGFSIVPGQKELSEDTQPEPRSWEEQGRDSSGTSLVVSCPAVPCVVWAGLAASWVESQATAVFWHRHYFLHSLAGPGHTFLPELDSMGYQQRDNYSVDPPTQFN